MPQPTPLPLFPPAPALPASARACVSDRRSTAGSLYIHVPFCFHKCHYCDFYSIVDTQGRQEAYVARLIRELSAMAPAAGPLRTIFVGGGTPTLLATPLWQTLLGALHAAFDTSLIRRGEGEFTVECNPETATPDLFRVLARGGVNRLSIGAQSFSPTHLKTLERWHDPANVARALALAKDAGIARHSIDLIYAIPGQTVDEWREDLARATALGTEHVSAYALTFEPGTAMFARRARGEVMPVEEDVEAEMFEVTARELAGVGLVRYEVSNFARPGAECRHNLAYWRQEDWLAAGPSASGHLGGTRWKNAPRLDDYLSRDDAGFAPLAEFEPAEPSRNLAEWIMTGLRLEEGIDPAALRVRAGAIDAGAPSRLDRAASAQAAKGLLDAGEGRWRLTDSGFLLANRVILALLGALSR